MTVKLKTTVIVSLVLFLLTGAFAQLSPRVKPDRTKEFGKSLKKFEKKGKGNSKNKVEDNSSDKENGNETPEEETIRVETDLVVNDVLVVNEKGNAILGLKPNDFIVAEDNSAQKIEIFSPAESASIPKSIVLIFYNGSDKCYNHEANIKGAKALVDKLAPNDKMAIVTTDIKLILDFTTDKALLKKTLDEVSSNLKHYSLINKEYGTLMAVLDEMFNETDVRPIVIFQVPGYEAFNLKVDEDAIPTTEYQRKEITRRFSKRKYGFSNVRKSILQSRATIYSIAPQMRFIGLSREEQLRRGQIFAEIWKSGIREAFRNTDPLQITYEDNLQAKLIDDLLALQKGLAQTATLAGGYTEFLETPGDAQRVYETIFKVINNRYTIGYYSTNQTRDGKRRTVKIEVKGHPEYIVMGRKSYFAAEQ